MALAAIAMALGCGDSSGPTINRLIGGIGINRADSIPAGFAVVVAESLPLRATVSDTAGNVLSGQVVTWSSAGSAAVVGPSGVVVGVTPGFAFIRASTGGHRDSVQVQVLPPVDSIAIIPSAIGIVPGGTAQAAPILYLSGTPQASYGRPLRWSSSSPAAATVSGWFVGDVVGLAPGSTILTATGSSAARSLTVDVSLLSYAAIDAGVRSSCGLTTIGRVYCWGVNSTYQLGHPFDAFDSLPIRVEGIPPATQVVFGGTSVCALAANGDAWCWGFDIGNLGRGAPSPNGAELPGLVSGGLQFASLAMGEASTCGIASGGAGYCWGFGGWGVLGTGDTLTRAAPAAVAGGLTLSVISTTPDRPDFNYPHDEQLHSCAVTTGGAGYCWGRNLYGQLGSGDTTDHTAPVAVAGGHTFSTISAGWEYTCAVEAGGAGYCWGDNTDGRLGSAGGADSLPRAIGGGLTLATISAGTRHTCGITTAGAAYCWGANTNGELGDGSHTPSSAPVPVSGGLVFSSITTGVGFTCGVTTAHVAYCWGGVEFETANGAAGSTVPVRVTGQP